MTNSWVGTTIPQSAELEKVIRSVLETGRTVIFAVKRELAPDDLDGTPPTSPVEMPSLRFDGECKADDDFFDFEDAVET